MVATHHMGLVLLESAQAQKEITVNEALVRLDRLCLPVVKDKDLATPPASPLEDDVYLVGASATGDWSGREDHIAYYDQIWRFIVPQDRMRVLVADESVFYVYNGSAWVSWV